MAQNTMTDDNFPELLARARGGERDAREALARLMTFEAHAVARRQLGPKLRRRLESVDVTQSVVGYAVDKIDAFRGVTRNELRAWLARQVVNRIRDHADHFGAQKRDMKREEPLRAERDSVPGVLPPARTATPSMTAVTRERVEQLRAAMSELDDEDRRLIERRQQGVAWAKLAAEFDLPSADAARMRCVRIQNRLARLLGGLEA